MPFIAPLLRCGFQHITQLDYFHHDLAEELRIADSGLRIENYQSANQAVFHDILLRTYDGTLDCPELNGRRTIEEIIEGHQHQGIFRSESWWLAFVKDQPVAVVILTEVPGWQGWELSYVGVVPKRGAEGIGKALAQRAMRAAREAGRHQAECVRRCPQFASATVLYANLGFIRDERREVLLFFFTDLADDAG